MINNLIFYKLLPATDFQSPHPYARATRGRARSALRRDRRPENLYSYVRVLLYNNGAK